MDIHHYRNLTVIHESEVQFGDPGILDNAIIAKPPNFSGDVICHLNIKDAMEEEFNISLQVEDISQFGADYIIVLDSVATKLLVLRKGYVSVAGFNLPFIPWSPDYGSITVPLYNGLSNSHGSLEELVIAGPNQDLTIEILGLPPHLCCESIVRHLLNRIYTVCDVVFIHGNLTYFVSAYGSEMVVPDIAHIVVRKESGFGELVTIWPLWYETRTADMYPYSGSLQSSIPTEERRGSDSFINGLLCFIW